MLSLIHTGELEVFHTMLLKYAPKRQHFPYDSMKARLMLAALDWNNQSRIKVLDTEGKVKEDLVYSKRRKMWVSRARYIRQSHHIEPLMDRVVALRRDRETLPPMTRPLSGITSHVAAVIKPEKSAKVSRFK